MSEKNQQNHICTKKKSRYFETYISRVIVHVSDHTISSDAKQQLNSALISITKKISSLAADLVYTAKRKILSSKEIISAIKIILNGELLKNVLFEGTQAVDRFLISPDATRGMSRQNKAEILFPPSLIEKFIRDFGYRKIMVNKMAPIYLAAVLEYITQDILQLCGEITSRKGKRRITIKDIETSIKIDPEMKQLFDFCKIKFLNTGVISYIHPKLFPSLNIERKKSDSSLREIVKLQKSDRLLLSKNPFEKIVREIFSEFKEGNVRISSNVFTILQYYIEKYVTDLLYKSNSASIHAGRMKLTKKDIDFIVSILKNTFPEKVNVENEPSFGMLDISHLLNDDSENHAA